ncbi:MAG: 2Fe-2S iron-sulfur cluster binding domain-containing protein [Solobacterium sp.]|nr:2Fe-2S iron-sulfur cluster binding domain-containing protein [Solobacterium sp.]
MKIFGFFKDVTGANRVINARRRLIAGGSPENQYKDHIKEVANELHPALTRVVVTKVEDVSPTARRFTFEATDGDKLPPFQAGQYASLDLTIGDTVTTRPYSISSAPFEARTGEHPFFQITVRNGRPETGFAANWLYANVKEGDRFNAHLPFGEFHYEPLRDAKNVVALAGGSGITPFCSMAKEIEHGTLDMNLTILYGSVSTKDIILEEDLKAIRSDRVKFVNVISGDEDYEGEKGFLTKEIIRKYSDGDTTYFVCGPLPMYHFVKGELEALDVPARRIRMEVFGAPRDVTAAEGYPENFKPKTFKLTVLRGIQEDVIDADSAEPLTVALERAGIRSNSRCRSGACGFCRARLVKGEVFVPAEGDGRRRADKANGYVHACSTWPLSDCTIRIPIV